MKNWKSISTEKRNLLIDLGMVTWRTRQEVSELLRIIARRTTEIRFDNIIHDIIVSDMNQYEVLRYLRMVEIPIKEVVYIGQYILVFKYEGPVKRFGETVSNVKLFTEVAKTYPNPSKKALANLSFQYKKLRGYTNSAKVELDERYLTMVRETFSFK